MTGRERRDLIVANIGRQNGRDREAESESERDSNVTLESEFISNIQLTSATNYVFPIVVFFILCYIYLSANVK